MDGREGMALSGAASYYLHRGVGGGSYFGSGFVTPTGLHVPPDPPGFRLQTTHPRISVQSNVRDFSVGSAFPLESTTPSFPHGLDMGVPMGEQPVKKKRGRPRKYGPGGTSMSLGLSPMPPSAISPTPKRVRGRPRGSGWKQQLAPLGEWMNGSAGLAFTPHIITITAGEDIASKILSFSQQRPRAICILSANGAVSAVTLRRPISSDSTVTYEGRFQILCLSGSYLVAESGGPRSRTGGLSVSLCTSDGCVIGGGVGGMLLAGGLVQVVLCSFVYEGSKSENKIEVGSMGEQRSALQPGENSGTAGSAPPTRNLTTISSAGFWPGSRSDVRNLQTEIDLMRG